MTFGWDRRKNRANLARNGIDFADAIGIFDGPTLEKVDDRFDYVDLHGRNGDGAPDYFGMEG